MGGLQEIFQLFDRFIENKIELNFEKGILQAIGYKEFYNFYNHMKDNANQQDIELMMSDAKNINENNF